MIPDRRLSPPTKNHPPQRRRPTCEANLVGRAPRCCARRALGRTNPHLQDESEKNVPVTADDVKRLRELSGAGVMDCKRALDESGGDVDKAVKILKEKGIASADKKAGRETSQGLVESYIHAGGRIGVLVEVNCETDFVARTPEFKQLVHDIAMQIAGIPTTLAVTEEDLPKNAEGSVEETVLMKQSFIKDSSKTIEQLVKAAIGQTGENIRVRRFTRFELGQ
jgi:elongation factor Ts